MSDIKTKPFKHTHRRLKQLCLTLALCSPLIGHSAIELVPPSSGQHWNDNEAIKLQLSADIMQLLANEEIVVELDAINITDMLSQDGNNIVYMPLQKLTTGTHALRLVHFSADGEVEEIAAWSLDVRSSSLLQSYSINSDSQLNAIYRMDEDNLNTPAPDRMQGQGSSMLGFNTRSEHWQTDGQFDLFYNSRNSQYEDTRTLDVGDFIVATDSKYLGATIGHHDLNQHNLIMENFHRRGLSVQGKAPSLQSKLTTFVYASRDMDGFGEGMGISDSQDRISGVIAESNPIPGQAEQLHISAIALSGKLTEPSYYSIQHENDTQQSDAHAISATSKLLNQRLTLYGEYAETQFDYSANDTLNAEKDYAHVVSASIQDSLDNGLYWNVGLESQTIGTFFKSLANDTLVNDKDQQRLFGGTQWQSIGIQVNLIKQHDNVEDLDILPTIETQQRSISSSWTPNIGQSSIFGSPALNLSLGTQEQQEVKTPNNAWQLPTHNQTDYWNSSINFNYLWGYWGLVLGESDYRDQAYAVNNSKSDDKELILSYNQDNWSLSPRVKHQKTNYLGFNQTTTNKEYELISSLHLLKRRLTASLEYRVNHNHISNDSLDETTMSTGASLSWALKQADHNDFGFDLSLSGQFNDYENRLDNSLNSDDYQVFLSLSTSLSTQHQQ